MVTHLASAVPARMLRNKVASLDEHQMTIVGALDMLIGGV
jgi:hypothetical protein